MMIQSNKRNWKKYNQHLVNRGNLGLLIKKEIFSKPRSTSRGRSYDKDFIAAIHLLRYIFKKPYRDLEGYIEYIIKDLLELQDIDIPDYTTIAKLIDRVNVSKRNYYQSTIYSYKDIELITDSTGITITHKGEWLLAKYSTNNGDNGKNIDSKAKFIKFHNSIDKDTFVSLSHTVTESIGENTHDTTQYPILIKNIKEEYDRITKSYADKEYDSQINYEVTENIRADYVCPIKKNVKNIKTGNIQRHISKILTQNNNDFKEWSKLTGYNKRVLIESWFSRFKRIMGSRTMSKTMRNIKKELEIKIHILNEYAMREASLDRCFNHSI